VFDHERIIFLLENDHAALPKTQDIPHFLGKRDLAFLCYLRGNGHMPSPYLEGISLLMILTNARGIIERKSGARRAYQKEEYGMWWMC
jgi:hypothetical protein